MTDPSQTPSPLAEASPTSLDELLSRDPMGYMAQDRGKIVAYLREQRKKWDSGKTTQKGQVEAGAPKAKAKGQIALPLDLKALGLVED